jgi:hypothetical protein
MAESVKIRAGKIPDLLTARELQQLLTSVQADLAALTAQLNLNCAPTTTPQRCQRTATAVTLNTTA